MLRLVQSVGFANTFWYIQVHLGVGRSDMELVIPGVFPGWFQEEFKAIVEPRLLIALGDVCLDVLVFELGPNVEVIAIPNQFGLGGIGIVGLRVTLDPSGAKVAYDGCIFPAWIRIEPIDFGWSACPTASIGIALLGHDGMTTQNAKSGPQPKATAVI